MCHITGPNNGLASDSMKCAFGASIQRNYVNKKLSKRMQRYEAFTISYATYHAHKWPEIMENAWKQLPESQCVTKTACSNFTNSFEDWQKATS